MKSFLLLFAIILATLVFMTSSCKKYDYMSNAIITGCDQRMCVCCGGLMITFNGETRPYAGDFKLIENDLGITCHETFPIYVKVDWTSDPNKCFGKYITVTKLKRQ